MRLFQIGTLILVTGLTVIGFQNCAQRGAITSSQATSSDQTAMAKSISDMAVEIKSLSARDLSCASDADCTVVSVGKSHCGGPTFLVLNSKKSDDYKSVVQMAASYTEIESDYLKSNGLVRSCDMLMAPTPHCVSNVCSTAL